MLFFHSTPSRRAPGKLKPQAAIFWNCPMQPWSSKKTKTGFREFCVCVYLPLYIHVHTGINCCMPDTLASYEGSDAETSDQNTFDFKSWNQKLLTFRSSSSSHLHARTTETTETTTNDFIVVVSDLFPFLLCCFPIPIHQSTFGTFTPARPMSSTSKPSKSSTVPQRCTESSSSLTSQGFKRSKSSQCYW